MVKQTTVENHYVPQHYLKAFTSKANTKTLILWYTCLKHGASKQVTPTQICKEAYLYTFKAEAGDDDSVEQMFTQAETLCAPIIQSMIATRCLPSGQDLAELVGFITLQLVRTTRFRSFIDQHLNQAIQGLLKADISSPGAKERYHHFAEKNPGLSFEDLQKLILKDGYDYVGTQKYHIKSMLEHFQDLLPHLLRRKWSLLVVPDSSKRGFITSDNPVSAGVGLTGLRNTNVVFPVSHDSILMGRTYGDSRVLPATKLMIAAMNRITLINAFEYVYSMQKDFYWLDNDGTVKQKAQLIEQIKQNRPLHTQ
jgi:hypothetical protein